MSYLARRLASICCACSEVESSVASDKSEVDSSADSSSLLDVAPPFAELLRDLAIYRSMQDSAWRSKASKQKGMTLRLSPHQRLLPSNNKCCVNCAQTPILCLDAVLTTTVQKLVHVSKIIPSDCIKHTQAIPFKCAGIERGTYRK